MESCKLTETVSTALETEQKKPIETHFFVECDGCGINPIKGNRYKCTIRDNYDLCSICYNKEEQQYQMILIETSGYKKKTVELTIFEVCVQKCKFVLNSSGKILLDDYCSTLSEVEENEKLSMIEVKTQQLLAEYPSPVIRFINFDDLVSFGSFPRYPDNKELTCALDSIDRDNSLLIFISHCWMRGWSGADGWDGSHHPDNAKGDKWKLCVNGINRIIETQAPRMKNCYVWLDYGCLDQDNKTNLTDELERYDKIMECCDLMFTPIVDRMHMQWTIPVPSFNLFDDYKAEHWNGGPNSYLNRGWCRIEMLYAAHIPVLQNNNGERHLMFDCGLASQCLLNRRPHFLYGTREDTSQISPIMMAPLDYSFLRIYHPLDGNLSVSSDIQSIQTLLAELQPYIERNQIIAGYSGEKNEKGERHGFGEYLHHDGTHYCGMWENDQPHGKGKMVLFNGEIHEGQFEYGKLCGYGTAVFSNGDKYEGYFENGVQHFTGKFTGANGAFYEGELQCGKKHGNGYFRNPNGDIYVGWFSENKLDKYGVYTYTNGDIYKGFFKNDEMNGDGIMYFANGAQKSGRWFNGLFIEGTVQYTDGVVYKGTYHEGRPHGYGIIHYKNGSKYEGYFSRGYRHGYGKMYYNGILIKIGEWRNDSFVMRKNSFGEVYYWFQSYDWPPAAKRNYKKNIRSQKL